MIVGIAHSEDAAFKFSEMLRRSPSVSNVRMIGSNSERTAGLILTRFNLEIVLSQAARSEEKT